MWRYLKARASTVRGSIVQSMITVRGAECAARSVSPIIAITASLALASCSSPSVSSKLSASGFKTTTAKSRSKIPLGGGVRKIGKPYKIAGRWYHPKHQPGYDRTGIASWYGRQFHGKKTANGEVFNMNNLTAAHPTLPLPSYVRVINPANGRSLIVRVNDRGPYAHKRLIDLSKKTADLLGMKNLGTARIRVIYLGPAPLNGNSSRERTYLARQPWYRSKYAGKGTKGSWTSFFSLGGPRAN